MFIQYKYITHCHAQNNIISMPTVFSVPFFTMGESTNVWPFKEMSNHVRWVIRWNIKSRLLLAAEMRLKVVTLKDILVVRLVGGLRWTDAKPAYRLYRVAYTHVDRFEETIAGTWWALPFNSRGIIFNYSLLYTVLLLAPSNRSIVMECSAVP